MGVTVNGLDDLMNLVKNTKNMSKALDNKNLQKLAEEDAHNLEPIIQDEFKKAADKTVINGYYLEGRGSVYNENTIAFPGTYKPKFAKPYLTYKDSSSGTGVEITIGGRDAVILNYGLAPLTMPQFRWVMNSLDGEYNAHNKVSGSGNWFRAIELSSGNSEPLLSFGKDSRFFAQYSTPTNFVGEVLDKYKKDLKSENTIYALNHNKIRLLIENELKK